MSRQRERYAGPYAAKFARERKDRPLDWLLKACVDSECVELHHIGVPADDVSGERRMLDVGISNTR